MEAYCGCGGTVLLGGNPYELEDERLPTGRDEEANNEAFDQGELRSPEDEKG